MGDHKVYLGNLSDDCRERDLEKFLKGYGTVRNISIKVSDVRKTSGVNMMTTDTCLTEMIFTCVIILINKLKGSFSRNI